MFYIPPFLNAKKKEGFDNNKNCVALSSKGQVVLPKAIRDASKLGVEKKARRVIGVWL